NDNAVDLTTGPDGSIYVNDETAGWLRINPKQLTPLGPRAHIATHHKATSPAHKAAPPAFSRSSLATRHHPPSSCNPRQARARRAAIREGAEDGGGGGPRAGALMRPGGLDGHADRPPRGGPELRGEAVHVRHPPRAGGTERRDPGEPRHRRALPLTGRPPG